MKYLCSISAAYFGNNSFGVWFSSVVYILSQWIPPPLQTAGPQLSRCAAFSLPSNTCQDALPTSGGQAAPIVEQFSPLVKAHQRLAPSVILKKRTGKLFVFSGFKHSRLLIPSGLGRLPRK